ncbi:hypothetical protein E7681_15905 [Thalassobius vesicularis]|uniref:Ferrochelatase n=1 Tax=Thalassobius vesicularis TaxID=1294297 RepID=A0A4S3M5R4_9RHOB|nr:hypothetical protein [Thalassobius vesicularis]THD72004.1 hypothetical protein E7681_15905 [Thalassobius vesicularis]
MKKMILALAVTAAVAPGFALAGTPVAGTTEPAPAKDDAFAPSSLAAGSLGGSGATAAAIIAVTAIAVAVAGGTD